MTLEPGEESLVITCRGEEAWGCVGGSVKRMGHTSEEFLGIPEGVTGLSRRGL